MKPNWTNVNVTGYRNWLRRAFPVLDDMADDMYHKQHKKTNCSVDGDTDEGSDGKSMLRPLLRLPPMSFLFKSPSHPPFREPLSSRRDKPACFSPIDHPRPFSTEPGILSSAMEVKRRSSPLLMPQDV